MPIKHIISIDPGDVNNGFCYFQYNPETKTADTKIMKIMGSTEVYNMLKVIWGFGQAGPKPEWAEQPNPYNMFFVVENFRMDSHVRGAVFQWSEMLTSQMIGSVKLLASWMNAPVYMQEPGNVLPMARKWAPWPKMPKHIPDDKSAWLHGVHWMMQKKLIFTPSHVTMFGQEML